MEKFGKMIDYKYQLCYTQGIYPSVYHVLYKERRNQTDILICEVQSIKNAEYDQEEAK